MLAVAVVSLLIAVAMGVLLLRTKARLGAVSGDLGEAIRARDAADAARLLADAATTEALRERDAAMVQAETALAQAQAATSGGDQQAAELWALALASVRRTWEVSVAPSPGLASPLEGSNDQLRDAIGIEVAAAREDAGAMIDLEWSGGEVAAPAMAVRTLALAREVIDRLAKATDAAVLQVMVGPGEVTLEVTGSDVEGRPVPVERLLADVAPEHQVAPGRFELTSQRLD